MFRAARHAVPTAAALLALPLVACFGPNEVERDAEVASESFYTLETRSLDGAPAPLSEYRGEVALVVNTASECGLTPQYAGLQELYETYRERDFVVLGFPSNDFGGQEPGSPEEIAAFCADNYSVTFPMFEKVQTKEGDGQSPVYAYLGAATGSLPGWNFGKYLVARDGRVIAFYDSRTAPDDAELTHAIESAIGG